MIHPTAIIHRDALLGADVEVGPYAVIDRGVRLGDGCRVGPHVHLTGQITIGARNVFHSGCVIGDAPQDLKYRDAPTRLRTGDDCTFREHVTVHRSNKLEEDTVLGSDCYLMQHAHVAHNCCVGDHVIIAGGAMLAGHVVVQDRAFISGNCLVHQFCRVGKLAMMQGGSAISKDLPPFCVSRGGNGLCGLNTVGLRRAGLTAGERLELKQLYHYLFRQRRALRTLLTEARGRFSTAPAVELMDFLAASRRGVITDTGIRHADVETED